MAEPILYFTDPVTQELLRRRWSLQVIDGPDRGKTAELRDAPALIGAAPSASLVLSDDTVSRYHAELDPLAHGLRVRDLDSTNGSFLVGEDRIRAGFVSNGEIFRVGQTVVRAVARDEAAASEIETDPHLTPPGEVEILGGLSAVATRSKALFRLIRRIAPSSSPVLLEGPIGSGKGALAHLIHELSGRTGPLRTLAAGIAPPTSLGRILFGREQEAGLLELAAAGTLYLEDVELLPEPVAARLTRALRQGEVEREGDPKVRRIDVVLVTATTKPLAHLDPGLLGEVGAIRLSVAGLDERRADLPYLFDALLTRHCRAPIRVGTGVRAFLEAQRFPRNLKDLELLVGRVLTFPHPPNNPQELELWSALLAGVVEQHQGHLGRAAQSLGVSERTLLLALKNGGVDLGL
ncbi:MAG: sigma 54-interacting transcriptional regulator [Deltaproteobacteria bacterium]|nr:sigma 54-interacting transcriptional regulator [Deltaproteobacteria bacterium]